MARNKNSTALFEVIHAAKKPPKSSPNVDVPSPRWWSKGKKQTPPPVSAVTAPAGPVGRQKSWLSAAKKNGEVAPVPAATAEPVYELPTFDRAESTPVETVQNLEPAPRDDWDPTAGAVVESVSEPAPGPKKRFIDRFTERSQKVEPAPPQTISIPHGTPLSLSPDIEITHISDPDPAEDEPAPRAKKSRRAAGGEMAFVDRAAHEIKFRLSYGGMVAAVAILLMSLAIAFLAGKRFAGDSTDAQTAGRDTVGSPELMMGVESPGPQPPVAPPVVARPDVLQLTQRPAKPAQQPAPPAPTPAPTLAKTPREVGSVYVVAHSYPGTDLDIATAACEYLNRNGIPCTLVKGLGEWTLHDWYSVVGTRPFTKHDPELNEYEHAIAALGQKFTNKSYNQFQPKAYTWRVDSETERE